MRRICLLLALVFGLHSTALAESASLFDGRLQLEAPAEFTSLTDEEIDSAFGRGAFRPQAVFVSPTQKTKLSVTWTEAELGPDEVDAIRQSLSAGLDDRPGLEWLQNRMVKVDQKDWFQLVYRLDDEESPERDEMWGTSLDGKLLVLALSCPDGVGDKRGREMRQVIDSLKLQER